MPASLLPKLRDHYAEFLDHVSLVHLRLLASPTCVGLRYGRPCSSPLSFSCPQTLRSSGSANLPLDVTSQACALPAYTVNPQDRLRFVSVSLSASSLQDGAGMSTGCPSATPLGPRLRV